MDFSIFSTKVCEKKYSEARWENRKIVAIFRPNRIQFAKSSVAFFRIQFAKKCENATDGHPWSLILE